MPIGVSQHGNEAVLVVEADPGEEISSAVSGSVSEENDFGVSTSWSILVSLDSASEAALVCVLFLKTHLEFIKSSGGVRNLQKKETNKNGQH